jgi:hypothetical protein
MAASVLVGDQILNCFLRGVAPTLPARVFVSLHTGDPGAAGDNEVTATDWPSYARQDAANGGAIDTGFGAPADKVVLNAQRLDYGSVNGSVTIVISHFAIWDAAVGGNLYIYGPLVDAKALAPTDECVINPDRLQATVI